MRYKIGMVLAAAVLSVSVTGAQEFWQKKASNTWSESECKKLLQDSPWARTHELAAMVLRPLGMETDRREDNVRRAGYAVQIRSAKPVREAMIQRAKLRSKYDQLPPATKQAIDKTSAEFVAQQFPDVIVIGVEYFSDSSLFDRDMATFWQQQTLALIKSTTHLIAGGQRIEPVNFFVAPGKGREFELIFPRLLNGKPVIGPNDKSFSVEFEYPQVGTDQNSGPAPRGRRGASASDGGNEYIAGGRVFVEFNVKKLTAPTGEVVY